MRESSVVFTRRKVVVSIHDYDLSIDNKDTI